MEDRTTLSRRSKRLKHHGSRWLLGGGVAALIGVLLMIAFDGFLEAAGLMLAFLATAPIVVGLGLRLSGATGRWGQSGAAVRLVAHAGPPAYLLQAAILPTSVPAVWMQSATSCA
jgi:hypothetical protein